MAESPEDVLPDDSLLTLDEYLDIVQSLSERSKFEIVHYLRYSDDETTTVADLSDVLDRDEQDIKQDLNALVNTVAVTRHQGPAPEGGDTLEYYRASSMSNTLLEDGVKEMLQREHELRNQSSR